MLRTTLMVLIKELAQRKGARVVRQSSRSGIGFSQKGGKLMV